MDERVRVGILGCGHVGGALVRLIHDHADVIEARAGVPLEVTRVAVHDLTKDRGLPLPARRFTDDAGAVVDDPDVDIVVEVIGGIEPARRLIVEALMGGKPVVTANKELVATHGRELFETAEGAGVDIRRVMGIVNGTTNYILTGMTEHGASFADALADAQRLGFAETDPTADVEGFDAAAKAAIIASIAFGARVVASDVYREGITSITADDIASARDLGYVVKLLAIAEDFDGEIAVRVHPAMVPEHHPLASVREAFNAVFIQGDAVGELMLYGRGAGGMPTASAVLGDLVDAAKNLVEGRKGATIGAMAPRPIRAIEQVESQFYLQMEVADRPGVLHAITGEFGRRDVSVRSMRQRGIGDDARLIFVTHKAREADLRGAADAVAQLEPVHRVGSVLRVIGEEE